MIFFFTLNNAVCRTTVASQMSGLCRISFIMWVNQADEWGEKDKLTKDLVSKRNTKAPALKIF